MKRLQITPWQAFFVLIAAMALLVLAVDASGNGYFQTFTALMLIQVMLAVSLTMTNGFTGMFSLGHPAFMTIGAYVAILFTYPVGRKGFAMPALPETVAQIHLSLPIAALVGGLTAALLGWLIGRLVVHLQTHYLAVATLGLIIVVQTFALNLDGFTRGGRGITGVPREATLALIGFFTVLVIVLCWRIKHASVGRAMLAVRENEMAARCFGIKAIRLKVIAFVLGAGIAGFCGALLPHVVSVMSPKSFGLILAFNLVAIIVVGGQGSIIGAIFSAVLITFGSESLRQVEEATGVYGMTQVIVAVALIAFLLVRPKGLFGLKEPFVRTS
ncbi:branched-chain amino acid ABC transporter permease [Sulfitobacter sp. 916]|uniref:branched-chain amino acid ABC transporter permease n=1 Tax=Sulfitobacter sp. 916 TaxID=3368559 RepID=UPI0014478F92|nr:branched-chain amino acid ABC transporter permease [Rhodobacteraceae bacterium R_SAG2]